ncbi:hypothetical protein V6582_07055 [Agrobacterium vitis]|uniref:hypothetical protein n=1 Tax=Agrobacterium vitis TaxID=373 RepID=UPI0012E8C2CB|nr:hypothetical protein [Agrobacterium vitis]MVA27471.1 hypothetical protein [Agrobacterium vitis]
MGKPERKVRFRYAAGDHLIFVGKIVAGPASFSKRFLNPTLSDQRRPKPTPPKGRNRYKTDLFEQVHFFAKRQLQSTSFCL